MLLTYMYTFDFINLICVTLIYEFFGYSIFFKDLFDRWHKISHI